MGVAKFLAVLVGVRSRKQWSYRDLSRATGLETIYLTHLAKGIKCHPSRSTVHKIFRALGQSDVEAEAVYLLMNHRDIGIHTPEDCLPDPDYYTQVKEQSKHANNKRKPKRERVSARLPNLQAVSRNPTPLCCAGGGDVPELDT